MGISEKRRKDSRLIMLYKGLKGAACIPTNGLVPPISHTRNHHSLAFQTPLAYKYSFPSLHPHYKRSKVPERVPLSLRLSVRKIKLLSLLVLLSTPMGVDYVVIGFDMEVQPLVTHNAA